MPKEAQKKLLKAEVRRQLRDDIVHGRLRPGEVMRDLDLAARYGVSTSPVREAIADLAAERLIETTAHSVKRVAPLDRQHSLDLFEVFRLLALHGYTQGAARIDEAGLDRMTEVLARVNFEGGGSFSLIADFHDPIFIACRNRELRRMLALSHPWLQRLVILLIGRNRPRESTLEQAHATLNALRDRRHEEAVALFRQSLDELRAVIERMPEML